MPRPASLLLAAALSSLPAFTFSISSFAQGAPAAPIALGEDEVILKNGGMVRGTIVSIEPERQVTLIVAPSNEQRVIPWSEVDKVERGKHKPPPASPPGAAPIAQLAPAVQPGPGGPLPGYPPPGYPPAVAPAPTGGPGAPRVHIETDDPQVTLHRVTATVGVVGSYGSAVGMFSRAECRAPCDRVIDGRGGNEFFFAGDGIPASSRFQLADQNGDIEARVSAGSTGRRIGGWILTSVGGAGVVGGAIFLLSGSATSDDSSVGAGAVEDTSDSFTTMGAVSLGVGGAMLVGGIILLVTSGTTYELTQKSGQATGVRFSDGRLLF